MFPLLLSFGADTSTRYETYFFELPLETAILKGDAYLIDTLLTYQACDQCKLFPGDASTITPLEYAVETFGNVRQKSEKPSVVKLLAKHSKDVNCTLSDKPILIRVLLRWESLKQQGQGLYLNENEWCECIRILLESGADVTMLHEGQTSCLDIAHRLKSLKAQHLLSRWGAKCGTTKRFNFGLGNPFFASCVQAISGF